MLKFCIKVVLQKSFVFDKIYIYIKMENMQISEKYNSELKASQSLYERAEYDANRFNINCLAILCIIVTISEVLNEIGIFKVSLIVMRFSTILAFSFFITPLVVYLVHDKCLKKDKSILIMPNFKRLILTCTYLGIALICITLSLHAVIVLAIPPLIAAQYKNDKKLFAWIMFSSLILVPVGVYGGYFLGTLDRNLVNAEVPEEELAILSNRLQYATSTRMFELFIHYVLPRIFCMIAVVMLVFGITKRNGVMLKTQSVLNSQINREMENVAKMQKHVINSLATLIEDRDVGTGEHVIRTKTYVRLIADRLKNEEKYKDYLIDEMVEMIENAAPLHDVGKIAISDTILLKPGKLTNEEFDLMKTHTTKGREVVHDILTGVEDASFLRIAEEIAMSHHEKWDGSGYPQGLKGEEIPLSARIMAVADVFDALVSVRVYKKPVDPNDALDIMMAESGTHFDPDIMRVVDSMRDVLISASKASIIDIA